MRMPRLRMPKMQFPRHRFLIALVLAIAVGLCFHFNVYYHVKGSLRGDAYFKGMPTCYWADCLNGDYGRPQWLKSGYSFLGIKSSRTVADDEIYCKNSEVTGVLLQLAADAANNPNVRQSAISALDAFHSEQMASDLAPLCLSVMTDEQADINLRVQAASTLTRLAAARKIERIEVFDLLQSRNAQSRLYAAAVLWAQGEKREIAGPMLVRLLEESGSYDAVAMETLRRPIYSEAVPHLLRLSHHPNSYVRLESSLGMLNWLAKGISLKPDQEPLKSVRERLKALTSDPDAQISSLANRALKLAEEHK